MEQRYLLDTNILIYYIAEEIPDNEINKIENIRIYNPYDK